MHAPLAQPSAPGAPPALLLHSTTTNPAPAPPSRHAPDYAQYSDAPSAGARLPGSGTSENALATRTRWYGNAGDNAAHARSSATSCKRSSPRLAAATAAGENGSTSGNRPTSVRRSVPLLRAVVSQRQRSPLPCG